VILKEPIKDSEGEVSQLLLFQTSIQELTNKQPNIELKRW